MRKEHRYTLILQLILQGEVHGKQGQGQKKDFVALKFTVIVFDIDCKIVPRRSKQSPNGGRQHPERIDTLTRRSHTK